MESQNRTTSPAAVGVVQDANNLKQTSTHLPYILFLPAFFLVAATSFLPLFYAIRQSFFRSDFLELGQYVGLGNYIRYLVQDSGFEHLGLSVIYVVGSVISAAVIGSAFALLLNHEMRLRSFYRTVLIMPWIVSQLITGLLWSWIMNARFGPIAPILAEVGIGMPNLFTSLDWAMPTLIQANAWRSYPLIMVFVMAALQTVPSEVTEAARIDGASSWQNFWHVTFPLIRNTVLVSLVLTSLTTFNMVTLILILTGGGPAGATDVVALQVFKQGFQFYNVGIASAAAVIIFFCNILFTLVYMRVLRMERA